MMPAENIEVPLRWVEEVISALDAATTIGMRSCRDGDHLHYANHDRLREEALDWFEDWYVYHLRKMRTKP